MVEAYGKGLMGHSGIKKSLDILKRAFFFSHIKNVMLLYEKRVTCKQARSRVLPNGLYNLLSITSEP